MNEIKLFDRSIISKEHDVLFEKPQQISPPSTPDEVIKLFMLKDEIQSNKSHKNISAQKSCLKDRLTEFRLKQNVESISNTNSRNNSKQTHESPYAKQKREREYSIEINSMKSSNKALQLCRKVSFKYLNKRT